MRSQRQHGGFTLLEIMVVASVIGVIVAIAGATWFRQRELARAAACQENLMKIDHAVEIYAIDSRLNTGDTINWPGDLVRANNTGYLKKVPECPSSGIYAVPGVGSNPTCSIGSSNSPFAPHELPDE